MEVDVMFKVDSNIYIPAKNSTSDKFFCPIAVIQNPSSIRGDEFYECVEEDVVERYAGNINIERS
jgi:hypothetical protein